MKLQTRNINVYGINVREKNYGCFTKDECRLLPIDTKKNIP